MKRVIEVNIVDVESLDGLEFSEILTDTAERNTQPVVKDRVGDADIRAVGLEGDAVVAIEDLPSVELDFGRADGIGTVRVSCQSLAGQQQNHLSCVERLTAVDKVAGVVDKNPRELDVVGIYDRHGPMRIDSE